MGVVLQEIAIYEDLSAYENLMFWGRLYDMPKEELRKNVIKTLEIVDLVSRKDGRIRTFSGGMKPSLYAGASTLVLFLTHCVRRAHPDESGFGSQNSLSLSAAVWEPEGPLITGPITLLNMPVFILIAVSF
jgi:hypothetical protein